MAKTLIDSPNSPNSIRMRIGRFLHRLGRYGVLAAVLPFLQRLPRIGVAVPIRVRCGKQSTWVWIRPGTTDPAVCYEMFLGKELDVDLPNSPAVIVDAGAYTGISAAYFALKYPTAKIIAVEPNPVSFSLLRRNTQRFSNVTAVQAALWIDDTEMNLLDRETGDWGFTIVGGHQSRTGFRVPAVSMQSLMSQHGITQIDFLKLDIEGAEKEVLEQSGDWIDRVEGLAVELHDRIQPGCTAAMDLATADFDRREIRGEKTICTRIKAPRAACHNDAA